jgi:DNA mismatch repair ATPase MutS
MDLQTTMRGMEIFGGLSEAFPELKDYIDEGGLAKYIVEYAGLPAKVVRSDDEVAAIKEQRAEQQAMMQQQQEEMMAAEKAQKAAPMLKVMSDAGETIDEPAA